jgi:hypothetical protein
MINAIQARELVAESGVEADAVLKTLDPLITNAAKEGKRELFYFLDAERTSSNLPSTPLNKMVLSKLGTLGFSANMSWHGVSYVPRGLADDDGNGPQHKNFGYLIRW